MSDSKTAKQIEVVPCMTCNIEGRFCVTENGYFRWVTADRRCGTEAEAQTKAAELREQVPVAETSVEETRNGECEGEDNRSSDKRERTSPAPDAAAQPTETRPPQHEHPEMCPVCDSPYCEHDEAEQNLIKKAWEAGYAARAAAPVEPPKLMMQEFKGDQPHEFSPDCRASGCTPVPATEPVEQAPRPQVHDGIIRAVNMVSTLHSRLDCEELTDDHLKALDDIRTHLLGVSLIGYDPAAASSPVARPHKFVGEGHGCEECHNERGDVIHTLAEPVARVEQPTPRSCGKPAGSLHPRLGLSYGCVLTEGHEGDHRPGGNCFAHGKYVGLQCPQWPKCAEEVYTKGKEILTAPAAPVVAQRPDFALIAAEKIFALFKNASYFSTRNSEHKQQMVEGWAEIIRSEAYSTPFSYRGYSNE